MSSPSLSIVTVALNAAKDLPLTIESVVNQTYDDFEFIVLDGLSWDGSAEIYARYADLIDQFETIDDAGIYQAMNYATEIATGEYILFMNAGDRLHRNDSIEAMLSRITDNPDIFYGDHIYIDRGREFLKRATDFQWLRRKLFAGDVDHHWHSRIPGHQATFTRTALLRELKYDSRFTICADHDFLFRASDSGAKFQYIDEIVSQYLAGGYSGAQGDLINREWALAYRSRSLRPTKVDALFFGGIGQSPYPAFAPFSGALVTGAFGDEGPIDIAGNTTLVRWCGVAQIQSPTNSSALGIVIYGRNKWEDQTLSIVQDGRTLANVDLPVGDFHREIMFDSLVEPGTRLSLIPEKYDYLSEDDRRRAGFLLGEFYFKAYRTINRDEIIIAEAPVNEAADLLRSGWSEIEPDAGLVWSNREEATLSLMTGEPQEMIDLYLHGNPHVKGTQTIHLSLNGEPLRVLKLDSGRNPTRFSIPVEGAWRTGINEVQLKVNKLAKPPRDNRSLGIALTRVSFR